MLGRFLEFSIPTPDIGASVEFYERLGFSQAQAREVWAHPYGVVTDGRIVIGLHQDRGREPSLTFVRQDVAALCAELERQGVQLTYRRTGAEAFHEIGLADPSGQPLAVVEARTYSPPSRRSDVTSLCGYFVELSMPATDLEAAQRFWEPLGFVATGELDEPYPRFTMTSDHLSIAFHPPRTLNRVALVFADPQMAGRIARLRELGGEPAGKLPRGLDPASSALIEAPEGTSLLLVGGEL
ncbi:MAG TPA: VOC family protein [Steroidobacteraceae bacterium]|nr:VOC family protein [Steroidobacteraceae bacterium]